MNKQLKAIPFLLCGLILLSIVFLTGFTPKTKNVIKNVYQVYLDGNEIGIIDSKQELEAYINNQQQLLKEKFHVDTIYSPEGLDIRLYKTYTDKVEKVEDLYKKINNKKPFTVKGYSVILKNAEDKSNTIYVIDKSIFYTSMEKCIETFIDPEEYQLYLDNNQIQIKETGSIIENVELKDPPIIREEFISVDKEIFLNTDNLTKYLLFGTTEKQSSYTVKAGDTISQVAFNNKLAPAEFLIANPEFTDENNLLYAGQEVVIGLINPQFHLVVEKHVVEDTIKTYQTDIKYDNNLVIGTENVIQNGEDGLDRITKKEQYINGEFVSVVNIGTVELKPSINQIKVKGGKTVPTVGDVGSWGWPSVQGYTLTSGFGWRWGRMHVGLDIAGVGHGSPIYASNNGVVYKTGYGSSMGNYVYIDHNNGYYSTYLHLSKITVTEGQTVARGQQIGTMGNTGVSTGTHLHFEIWTGGAPYEGGVVHDPLPYLRGKK